MSMLLLVLLLLLFFICSDVDKRALRVSTASNIACWDVFFGLGHQAPRSPMLGESKDLFVSLRVRNLHIECTDGHRTAI